MWSSTLWNGKRMRNEGFEGMGFPHKRSTPLFTQQRWSQGNEKFLNLNPNSHQNLKPLQQQSPLGLQLKKTSSFLELIQRKLSQEKASEAEELRLSKKKENLFKASNFAASRLRVGSWEYKTVNAGSGLMVKFYYAKHKLVWEVLHSGLKYKMEIQWSDITALKAKLTDNETGTLSLVLGKAPAFFKETDPQPKKHTLWHKSTDFTGGQASTYRQHFLEFPPGVLDKHYKRLVQCDSRLGLLSQLPEPILGTPYFLTIAANPRQLKDGVVNQPDAYNLHDIAPISVPQGSPSSIELVSLGTTNDSSNCTQSPLSDTLTSFDHGIPRLEPVTESPISSLHDLVLLSTSSSVEQWGSLPRPHKELPKNIFGQAAGTPNSGVLNGAPLSTFSNGVSHQGFSGCEVSLEDLLNVEPQVSFGIPHEDLSKATHHLFSGIGTCATDVNTNSEAHIFETLEGPNLQPPLSVDDYVDQLDLEELHQALLSDTTTAPDENFLMPRVDSLMDFLQSEQNSKNNPMNRLVNSEEIVLEPVIAHGLMPEYKIVAQEKNLNDSEGVLDENFLMSKVDSLSNFLQYAENIPLDGLVNSEGVQDGKVLEPVYAYGSTLDVLAQEKNLNGSTDFMQQRTMPRNDSCIEFLHDLPRIASLPHICSYGDFRY